MHVTCDLYIVRIPTSTRRTSPRKLPEIRYYRTPARMSAQRSSIEDVAPQDDVPSLRPSIEGHTHTLTPGAPSRTPQTSPLRQPLSADIVDDDPEFLALIQAARQQLIRDRTTRASTITDNSPAMNSDLRQARPVSNAALDDSLRDSSSDSDDLVNP
ncbi:uncharacterized protein LY89DRAFT_507162 [Mollisia scopiformis]|uniref:Uncharacterized protein n=1 Tax=Mollisia scopiformis TaxID=149040 RepID=A0A194XFE2_MOLSC|nr:uncharacterized protein LY89DRAFT_507162 [Mollisia scopiformis]KUJ18888.1 hypothetical protein LY89DRAFT_507162 [Mollisia scopiformis]